MTAGVHIVADRDNRLGTAMPDPSRPAAVQPAARPATSALIVNAVVFEIGWFACVLGAAHGLALPGVAFAAVIVIWQTARARRRTAELQLLGIALLLGLLCDSALGASGWIVYAASPLAPLAPLWILALWALFATTLNLSLAWLQQRLVLAALLGVAAGPLSYWGGVRLGALQFAAPLQAVLALALVWGALTPLLSMLAGALSRRAARPAPSRGAA